MFRSCGLKAGVVGISPLLLVPCKWGGWTVRAEKVGASGEADRAGQGACSECWTGPVGVSKRTCRPARSSCLGDGPVHSAVAGEALGLESGRGLVPTAASGKPLPFLSIGFLLRPGARVLNTDMGGQPRFESKHLLFSEAP